MHRLSKLYLKAKSAPNNFSYNELCAFAEEAGFELKRKKGSHRFYKHYRIIEAECILNLQNCHGKAKPYQVRQLLTLIDKYELLKEVD